MAAQSIVLERLDDITFSGVISDLDGVVYRGDNVIPHAVARFNHWASRGVPYCFVTNNAERNAQDYAEKIQGFGIDCGADQVLNSADVALQDLTRRFAKGAGAYVIGSPSLKARVEDAGFCLKEQDVAFVLVALDRSFDYAMMAAALRCILAGAELVGTNADVMRPSSGGFEPGAGAILHSIAVAANVTPKVLGKPDPALLFGALDRLKLAAEDVIMLGDQLATDIASARNAGIRGVLVETGVPFDRRSPIVPDYIVRSLAL